MDKKPSRRFFRVLPRNPWVKVVVEQEAEGRGRRVSLREKSEDAE
jgi:hypothetical protein